MYFLVLAAHPKADNPDYGSIDGALASCWVKAISAEEAESAARALLDDHGWHTEELDEPPRAIAREEHAEDPEKLALYDQANLDGFVMTLHTWPVGAPDEKRG
jgi:hypothetical protein